MVKTNRALTEFNSTVSILDVKTTKVAGIPLATYGSLTGVEEQLLDKISIQKVKLQLPLIELAKKAAEHLVSKSQDPASMDASKHEVMFVTILTNFNSTDPNHLSICEHVLPELLENHQEYLHFDKVSKRKAITWMMNGRVSQDFLGSTEFSQSLKRLGISLKTREELEASGELDEDEGSEMVGTWRVAADEIYWTHENSFSLPANIANELARFFIWERDEHQVPDTVMPQQEDNVPKKSGSSSKGSASLSNPKGSGQAITHSSKAQGSQTPSGAQRASAISPSSSSEKPFELSKLKPITKPAP